jgi:hypothetical protein
MDTTTTLVNFNLPTHYKNRFDLLCKYNGSNRTSQLNILIRDFIKSEENRLSTQLDENKLNVVLDKFVNKHSKPEPQSQPQPVRKPQQRRWEESYLDNGTPW